MYIPLKSPKSRTFPNSPQKYLSTSLSFVITSGLPCLKVTTLLIFMVINSLLFFIILSLSLLHTSLNTIELFCLFLYFFYKWHSTRCMFALEACFLPPVNITFLRLVCDVYRIFCCRTDIPICVYMLLLMNIWAVFSFCTSRIIVQ